MASFSALRSDIFGREEKRQHYGSYIKGLSAYDRHKKFMDDYVHFYPGNAVIGTSATIKTDLDTLRETYRFIRTEEDDSERTWEQRLAKRYYEKLFKEYCIADMSRYKESKIGFRWRTEKEVISGKGQFVCGNRKCNEKEGLSSYEVNFSYYENGENRQALVKLRVCPRCAYKLKYKKEKELENQLRQEKRKTRKRQRKKKIERRSKRRQASEEPEESDDSDGDTSSEEGSRSRSHGSKSPGNDERARKMSKGVQSTSCPGGPAKQPGRNDEFDQYFEGMFLSVEVSQRKSIRVCGAVVAAAAGVTAPSKQKIRIKLRSYWVPLIEQACQQILEAAKNTNALTMGPVPLPTKKRVYCVLRSPHVDKDSREHFEIRTHRRLIDLANPNAQTIDALMQLDLPAGVDVEVKLS
ncbi:hypothetical protein R1flu_025457 [Riccia fluitans]|uniref:Small ribosomal subunit protein uS10c n=1 Tax=Riccia fluitans TaxID=41844 RepID=A0ABD1XY67_9MARC